MPETWVVQPPCFPFLKEGSYEAVFIVSVSRRAGTTSLPWNLEPYAC